MTEARTERGMSVPVTCGMPAAHMARYKSLCVVRCTRYMCQRETHLHSIWPQKPNHCPLSMRRRVRSVAYETQLHAWQGSSNGSASGVANRETNMQWGLCCLWTEKKWRRSEGRAGLWMKVLLVMLTKLQRNSYTRRAGTRHVSRRHVRDERREIDGHVSFRRCGASTITSYVGRAREQNKCGEVTGPLYQHIKIQDTQCCRFSHLLISILLNVLDTFIVDDK